VAVFTAFAPMAIEFEKPPVLVLSPIRIEVPPETLLTVSK
jgi:hypothetical protein